MSKPKLLLADDSVTIQRLVNLTFADEGFDVITVGDGDSALREISSQQPDIVLADVNMPGPSGYEICALLRSIDETAKIPVILLVGSFEPFDAEEAARVGASAHLTKPFQSIRNLVDQVNVLLNLQPAPDETANIESVPDEPGAEMPDTSDIDSLYEQSFAETVEMPAEMAAALYSRDRLDDEMIETSYSAEADRAQNDFVETPLVDDGFDALDMRSANLAEAPEQNLDSTAGDFPEPVYDDLPGTSNESVSAASLAAIQSAQTEEFRHEARDPFATTADELDLDEIDLLGLTPENAEGPIEFTTPAAAAESGSKSQVVSLSPELLEIIVQKVVEKLSEKY